MIFLEDILAVGGQLYGTAQAHTFADFSYDSRQIQPGELFLAIRTPRADGHDYIPAALESGASGVICTVPRECPGATMIQCEDPVALVQRWAARRLRQVAPLVIGVTGSVGKTTTRHAIAELLKKPGPVFESRGSFNSLLGLPIALARLHDHHRFAVLEFGADRFGEIDRLAGLFPPQVAVITSIAATHLAAFGSPEGVAREKGALLEALPADGWAILNSDDPRVLALRERTPAHLLTFGLGEQADLRAADIRLQLDGTHLRLIWQGDSINTFTGLIGEPAITVALAAVGAALACGVPFEQAAERLKHVCALEGRLRPLPARGGATLLDDSFSASFPATMAALRTLAALPARRRVAVLGELAADTGPGADTAYTEIGRLAGQIVDHLICKGATLIAQAARRANPALDPVVVHTAAAALQALPADLGPGDLILVKGSAEARMEHVAAGLLDTGEDPARVLVRQGAGWRAVRIGAPDRPTWVRIDLDAIAHNIRRLREIAGVPLIAVLKADAYGHGAERVARVALSNGAKMLAVATLGEARILREADIAAPILVLGYTPPWQAREAALLGATCTIFDLDSAGALMDAAVASGRPVAVHVEIDTGMARLGLRPEEALPFLRQLAEQPLLQVEGLYTHFATADDTDEGFAREQLRRFNQVLGELDSAGLRPALVHAANSAALLRFPEARFDLVRPGVACYGLNPSAATPLPPDFRAALSFHSEVAQVKTVPAGVPISYGAAFITRRPSIIATLPVGYADGLRRSPAWREVLVRGQRAPIIGRICMDYAMLDVTEIAGVKRGDAVVLIGSQGEAAISADEVAGWLGTINYEVVSTILPRVPREVGD